LAKGDATSLLDIVQRHSGVSFGSGDMLNESGTMHIVHIASLLQGVRDPSIYIEANIEATQTVIDAAIAAGVCRLIYTSSAGIIFIGTGVRNVDERVPFLEKSFDVYSDAQEVFGPGDHQVEGSSYQAYHHSQTYVQTGDNSSLFSCTYVENITCAHRLVGNELIPPSSYTSTMSSKPKLDPENVTVRSNKPLHCALPPICATTEYHHVLHSYMQLLSPYVISAPNTESILSMFNAPFDPHELTDPIDHSQGGRLAFFITNGELIYFWDTTGLCNKHE
ncbi:hypothetical protein BKA82DRAFT_3988956, partial [Pisolithus tinctorius]